MPDPAMNEISLESKDDMAIVRFPPNLLNGLQPKIEKEIKNWLLLPVQLFVLDFHGVMTVEDAVLRELGLLKKVLHKNEKQVSTINATPRMQRFITEKGLRDMFNFCGSVTEARQKAGLKIQAQALNKDFLGPFVQGTLAALRQQANVQVEPGKPFKKDKPLGGDIAIAGIVNLNNALFRGSIVLAFSAPVFLKVYESMLGEKQETINDDNKDAVGELLNIAYGHAKKILVDERGIAMDRVIPTVLAGQNLSVNFNSSQPTFVLPFTSNAGNFHIEIIVEVKDH